MPTRLVVTFDAGPTWAHGPVREQPGWDVHAAFVDDLVERGTIVMGGPFADDSGSMLLIEGLDVAGAERLLAADPFIRNGVFALDRIRTWDVFVDVLSSAEAPGPSRSS